MFELSRQCSRCFAALILIALSHLDPPVYAGETHRHRQNHHAISSSPVLPQCAFNPSGYFYPKNSLAGELADFDHLTLWENPGEKDAGHRPGVYSKDGFYEFTKVNRIAPFEFSTASVNGVSFSFTGNFQRVCIFEEDTRANADAVFLAGEFAKVRAGKKIAEAQIEFLYSPLLRAAKEDVNARYPSGRTELFYATIEANFIKMRALLSHEASPNIIDLTSGDSPLMGAIRFVEDRKARTAVNILIEAGADVNLADNLGMTALMRAGYLFEDKDGAVVSRLLAAGANVNASDNYGTTVLMHSIHGATQEAALVKNVRAIIRAGANVDAHNKLGQTALSIAEEDQDHRIIDLLKHAGAKR